jgi:hypothetical protein
VEKKEKSSEKYLPEHIKDHFIITLPKIATDIDKHPPSAMNKINHT